MFKALLFLGAGCIIHAVGSNEMSAMGRLARKLPVTHVTFLIACLAISGIPPFSGFFSKDEILAACFAFSPVMGWTMAVIAGMTAFYMFRLYYGIFWGTPSENSAKHLHEAKTMTLPLMVLAAVTCVAGFIPFGHFVSADGTAYDIHLETQTVVTSITIALLAIALATWMYAHDRQPMANALQRRFRPLWTAAYHRFYIDEAYQFVTHRLIFGCVSRPIAWFDRHVVDGFFNFLAWSANAGGESIRSLQSGQVQQYAFVFLLGTLAIIFLLLI
jgi:NADH-quinone oxidoreductase subunit L